VVIRLVVALVLVAVAVVVAIVVDRRRPDAPTQGWRVPEQLDRRDFDGGDRRWLVVVFTSLTCDSCRSTVEKAQVLASAELAVQEVPYQARQDLHDRYGIDAVPTVVVADDEGVVRAHHIGPCSAADLWSAVADARGES
jgi:hypothetical protein